MNKINIFKLKYLFLILFSLISGFSIGLCAEYIYEKNTYHPYSWNEPPVIINCYGDDLLKSTSYGAISFWVIRGLEVGDYIHNPNDCINLKNGYIVIKKNSNLMGTATLGYSTKKKFFGSIYYSEIHLRPGSQNYSMLLIHELGHSFGYGHRSSPGNIMHPEYDMMGLELY